MTNKDLMPPMIQKEADKITAIRKALDPIGEDLLNGNAIDYFEDDELGFREGDLLRFMETPAFEKLTNLYTRAANDKKYEKMVDRTMMGLPTMSEADGGNWGAITKKMVSQFIPEKIYKKIIKTIYEKRIASDLITFNVNMPKGKVYTFNVQGDRMKAEVIDELTPIPTQGVAFSKIMVSPYTIGVGFNVSEEAVEQASIDIVKLMLEEVAWALAEKQDNDIMAMFLDKAGTKNTTKTFGIEQWVTDLKTFDDNMYVPNVAVVGNEVAMRFRLMADFADTNGWRTTPDILNTLISKGWIGSFYNIPIKRLHTSRLDTQYTLMVDNSTMINPVSVMVNKHGVRFDTERAAAYRAQSTYAYMAYAPAVLNANGILTTQYTS